MEKITGKDLIKAGLTPGPLFKIALDVATALLEKSSKKDVIDYIMAIVANPEPLDDFRDNLLCYQLAEAAAEEQRKNRVPEPVALGEPVPYRIWGREGIQDEAIQQMDTASRIPVTAGGALMPDAHVGYGLPIGGVWGLRNAVSPYAVGVDIACRMRISLVEPDSKTDFEWLNSVHGKRPNDSVDALHKNLRDAILSETRFGKGCHFENPNDHEVMDDTAWDTLPWLRKLKDTAHKQLGTSGGGNHFVEFGSVLMGRGEAKLANGKAYIALLSHSGSRGLGHKICEHYAGIAQQLCPLPDEARHLAYLDLDSEAGQEYWIAMNLAGRYAAANHEVIHRRVLGAVGLQACVVVENHHNFAWKEHHNGEDMIVHRKGATPAGEGEYGVIPGSRETASYIVIGKGNEESLNSASHGAGRCMGRREAERKLDRNEIAEKSRISGVDIISSGLDECPAVYKDIETVMAAQSDLVEIIGEFHPQIVRMADDGYVED